MRATAIAGLIFSVSTMSSAGAQSTPSSMPSYAEYLQVNQQGRQQFALDMDNDSLLLTRADGFYTSGNHLISQRVLAKKDHSIVYAWELGQDLYTASDINLRPEQLSPVDHPYAGWLYLGLKREQIQHEGQSLRLGLDVGCFGACAGGEWTQVHLHRLLRQALPQAWNTQLHSEWGAILNAAWRPHAWTLGRNTELNSQVSGRFGNIFSDASVQLQIQYGQWAHSPLAKKQLVFARAELRAVAYNASVQGAYFHQLDHALAPKRLVPEIEFGCQIQDQKWGLNASIIRRGNEIQTLANSSGAQNFARFRISYLLD